MNPTVAEYWATFRKKNQIETSEPYEVFGFGLTPTVIDELADLVVADKKIGTTSAVSLYDDDEPKPYVGAFSIVLNSAEQPMAVIETTQVEQLRFDDVTEAQARLEGEGDLSLGYWRQVHEEVFETLFQSELGRSFTGDELVIFETFKRVY
ncbi:ASCH domain-containing protein [Weissella viridescens]|uniref:ASCH domain-containing protein n=1 Tax=Weissella viridescens TaxID=1629 RepID=A0A3P2RCD1_WEIVI|nr:ASCH domain-containing protein [Weissella viridescens]RRG18307.1 ASCH domain-containing protein [Weissella viridescens]